MTTTTKNKSAKPLVLYFQAHQPLRLRRLGFLDIGDDINYFDEGSNTHILRRTVQNCYIPVNEILTELIKGHDNVKVTFCLSGPLIRQLEKFAPEGLASFKELVATGSVELLAETSHHSLASLLPNDEFTEQVRNHMDLVQHHFGVKPQVFRNTELIYSNSIGARVAQMGFKGILCDGVETLFDGREQTGLYKHPYHENFKILVRHNELSDDIGFRYINSDGPLDIHKYFHNIESTPGVVMLGLDYETFGEHVSASAGIVSFLRDLIIKASASESVQLMTPSDVFKGNAATEKLDVPEFISWADKGKDLSAWLENEIQNEAFLALQGLEDHVKKANNTEILETWRNLQTSDHFYYMCTKTAGDGEVHSYFSPYNSPYEAYINYMNVINDFKLKLQQAPSHDPQEALEFERRHEPVPHWAERAQADYHELTSR